MKKFLKIAGLAFLAIIIIGAIANMGTEDGADPAAGETKPAKSETKPEKPVQKPEKTKEKPGKAEFDQVESGMTIDQVEAILGKGSLTGESEAGGMKMQIYSWKAKGPLGANITVTFTDGKSDSKAQFGLDEQ